MHETVIQEHDGYLGEYSYPNTHQLEVGDVQKFVFGPDDYGPFWMTKEQAAANRNDVILGVTKRLKKTRKN